MNDKLIESKFTEIRKKVFVKEKVQPKKVFKNNKITN